MIQDMRTKGSSELVMISFKISGLKFKKLIMTMATFDFANSVNKHYIDYYYCLTCKMINSAL